ncbi:MAG: hypothetical protein R3Y11_12215 [Pseudomonadota bacterium]
MEKKAGRSTGRQSPDCMASTSMTIETADGVEQVNWNMGTGEITYGASSCEIEKQGDSEKSDEGNDMA